MNVKSIIKAIAKPLISQIITEILLEKKNIKFTIGQATFELWLEEQPSSGERWLLIIKNGLQIGKAYLSIA
jgi:hypothetical protein